MYVQMIDGRTCAGDERRRWRWDLGARDIVSNGYFVGGGARVRKEEVQDQQLGGWLGCGAELAEYLLHVGGGPVMTDEAQDEHRGVLDGLWSKEIVF
jgi:hypothetical protein